MREPKEGDGQAGKFRTVRNLTAMVGHVLLRASDHGQALGAIPPPRSSPECRCGENAEDEVLTAMHDLIGKHLTECWHRCWVVMVSEDGEGGATVTVAPA